jgi:signal transduction histidine kinase
MTPDERPDARALAGEVIDGVDVTLADAEGRILNVAAQPLHTGPDEQRRAVLVFRDVTSERLHSQELAAFAGVVAHDLLNPVTSVAGWAEVLEAELGHDDRGAADALGRITRGVERMRQLVQDLLTHARSKDATLTLSDVDLAALVDDVVLTRDTPHVTTGSLLPVRADAALVRQVLDNLIGNALKYVAPGVEPWVSVHAGPDDHDADMVQVRVVDNGIGIPDEELPHVFEEFHRAHAADYEGTGLGLAICRRIVERHGGRIGVEPNPGGDGSTFWFTLPAAHRAPTPAPSAREGATVA